MKSTIVIYPPFCHFTPEQWQNIGHEYDEVRDCMLGWDITDYGMGDFDKFGFSLITIRNGNRAMEDKYPKVYAEKLLYLKEGQYAPNHFHWFKTEDIINRGGGRFDAGMLYYSPQIWCSDNTDALDRVKIQYGTSFFYPVPSMGAHVSACPNHQTGRTVSLKTRGTVAMSGTFGYEMNPALLSREEKEEIREQIIQYKKRRKLIRDGRYYRLTNPFESNVAAWEFVSPDQKAAWLNIVIQEVHGCRDLYYVKLRGLQQQEIYTDAVTGKEYSGSALMKVGYPIPEMKGNVPSYQVCLRIQ